MTGTPFSDSCIVNILQCLGDDTSTAARFGRTTPVIDILARETDLDRVNAETVLIGIGEPPVRIHVVDTFAIQAALTRKRTDGKSITRKERVLAGGNDHFTHLFTSRFIKSDFFHPEYPEKFDNYEKAVKGACRLMKKTFEMVKSVDCVHIEKIPLNAEFLKKFSAYKNKIKKTTKLIFRNETQCTLSGGEFSELLNMMSLNSIHLITTFLPETSCITDLHLINLRSVILGAGRGRDFIEAYGITDETLKYWKNNTPHEITMQRVRTSFSLREIWIFIQHVVLVTKDNISYRFGVIRHTPKNEAALVQAQKTRKFKFTEKDRFIHNDLPEFALLNFRTYTFTYTGLANKNFSFTISM